MIDVMWKDVDYHDVRDADIYDVMWRWYLWCNGRWIFMM